MTPEQVAKDFHGECERKQVEDSWCRTHEHFWPTRQYAGCDVLAEAIDMCEQAVEAYGADLRAKVSSMPVVDREAVLALLEGGRDE